MTDPAAVAALATALVDSRVNPTLPGVGASRIIAALPAPWALVEVPEWHDGSMESELALLLAKARSHGNVSMDGRHNPLPSEYIAAQRFMDALVERVATNLPSYVEGYPGNDQTIWRAEARRLLGIEEGT